MISKISGAIGSFVVVLFFTVTLLYAAGADDTAEGLAGVGVTSPFKAVGAFLRKAPEIGPALDGSVSSGSGSTTAEHDTQDA